MADGITSLNAPNFGTSTGGTAGAAESTLTLGVDRQDVQPPPSTYHAWGTQINNLKSVVQSMSAYWKGGTRLQTLTQSANPFSVGEGGFWHDGTNPKFTNTAGTITTLGAGGNVSSTSNSDGTLTISPTTGNVVAGINLGHANAWTGVQTFTHVGGNSSAPTYTAGTGAGTGPTITGAGSDLAGYITVTTGTAPSANTLIVTVNFSSTFSSAPKGVLLTFANNVAAGTLSGTNTPFVDPTLDVTTTSFGIRIGSSALLASTTYRFSYLVIQ